MAYRLEANEKSSYVWEKEDILWDNRAGSSA
jgi:hypothetical protein